jgi:hypothetical protein
MSAPPKKTGGFSLYADLLDDKKGSTISGAPVKYDIKNIAGDEVQKKRDGIVWRPMMCDKDNQLT